MNLDQSKAFINVKEWRNNQKWTIQRDWQHRVHKTKKNKTCVGHHWMQTSTNNENKTRALLQTTGGKDEPNIGFMLKS